MFTSSKSLTRIENLHKRALRFMLDDYDQWKCWVNIPWTLKENINYALRFINETLNNLNPSFMS